MAHSIGGLVGSGQRIVEKKRRLLEKPRKRGSVPSSMRDFRSAFPLPTNSRPLFPLSLCRLGYCCCPVGRTRHVWPPSRDELNTAGLPRGRRVVPQSSCEEPARVVVLPAWLFATGSVVRPAGQCFFVMMLIALSLAVIWLCIEGNRVDG
jgi:hypothetical protein